MSKHFEKFDQVSFSYGCYDGFQVGLAGPISKWDEAKFKKWREEETKDFTGEMGYVKLGAKGRRGGGGRRHRYYKTPCDFLSQVQYFQYSKSVK